MPDPTVPRSERTYTEAELNAARAVDMAHKTEDGRGTIFYATGPAMPAELRKRAQRFRRLAEQSQLVAAALEREQLRWPLPTTNGDTHS